jgi:hypothetical protein
MLKGRQWPPISKWGLGGIPSHPRSERGGGDMSFVPPQVQRTRKTSVRRLEAQGRDFAARLGLVPKQISTGDRTILGKISKRGNRYLRVLFVQAAWVVLPTIGSTPWPR